LSASGRTAEQPKRKKVSQPINKGYQKIQPTRVGSLQNVANLAQSPQVVG